jgi:hypothetical protein
VTGKRSGAAPSRDMLLVCLTATGQLDATFQRSGDNYKGILSGGDEGGTPGPGTFGVLIRMWM